MIKNDLLQMIKANPMVMFYFKGSKCSACQALYPKVKMMLEAYPMIYLQVINLDEEPELAAYLNIYSVPAILLYIEGKEYVKEAGVFSLNILERKIKRLLELVE